MSTPYANDNLIFWLLTTPGRIFFLLNLISFSSCPPPLDSLTPLFDVEFPIICGSVFRQANMNLLAVKLWWNMCCDFGTSQLCDVPKSHCTLPLRNPLYIMVQGPWCSQTYGYFGCKGLKGFGPTDTTFSHTFTNDNLITISSPPSPRTPFWPV